MPFWRRGTRKWTLENKAVTLMIKMLKQPNAKPEVYDRESFL